MDATLAMHWRAWRARYLVTGPCGDDRTYVDSSQDSGQEGSITVSEAHGWGRLMLTMLAAVEPEARGLFDNMVRFAGDHPSTTGSGLMAWDVHDGCRTPPQEATSATDGDLDIALVLLAAHELWGSGGPINYRVEALRRIDSLARHEAVFPHGYMRLWEDIGRQDRRWANSRTSDYTMDDFRAFERATSDGRWKQMVEIGYRQLWALAAKSSAGFLPDFAIHLDGDSEPVPARFLERDLNGGYGYNGCRLPFRLGVDA